MRKIIKLFTLALIIVCYSKINAQVSPSNHVIGIDITQPQDSTFTYDSAFVNAYYVGMRQVGLHFLWKSSLEPTPQVYNFTYLDIANLYYPFYNVPVDLNIDPIETNVLEFPTDIASLPLNDPIVINRFKKLLDSVFAHIPNLQLSSLIIGSEIDAYLGTDAIKWAQYTSFYADVTAYAKTLRPGLKVACEAMYPGLTGASSSFLQTLNTHSDIIGVSYYPLNGNFTVKPPSSVATDMASVVNLYPSKPIFYYQLGYPSSTACSSSENLQAQFITQVFQTWDTYSNNIKMIDFTWQHDWSATAVAYWSSYYGISDPAFLGFLGSIGLRNWSGKGSDKLAYTELKCQAKLRGFNTLPITCSTGMSDNETDQLSIYPNPAHNKLFLVSSVIDLANSHIVIYNQLGQVVKHQQITENKTIELENLKNGIYFLLIQTNNTLIKQKFIIQK